MAGKVQQSPEALIAACPQGWCAETSALGAFVAADEGPVQLDGPSSLRAGHTLDRLLPHGFGPHPVQP